MKARLYKLREWLTLAEAIEYLQLVFEVEISEANLLRLALDGHLKLSVNFVNRAFAKKGTLVPRRHMPSELLDIAEGIPGNCLVDITNDNLSTDILPEGIVVILDQNGVFGEMFPFLEDKITKIDGVWDLAMVGSERTLVEQHYQKLTGGCEILDPPLESAFVLRGDEQVCQLSSDYSDGYDHYSNFPDDVFLVIRTKELIDLQVSTSSEKCRKVCDSERGLVLALLDTNHTFFAKELKIAVEAWIALYDKNPPQQTPRGGHKNYINKWLKEKDPSLSNRARDRITTIVNPNTKGGASPT